MSEFGMLDKKSVMALANGTVVNGLVYVREYSKLLTKNNSNYIGGTLECVGSIPFKVWSGETYNKMMADSYEKVICKVNAEVNDYNGTRSLIIKLIEKADGTDIGCEAFFEHKYDPNELWNSLINILNANCSPQAVEVFNTVISGEVKDRFIKEFAAVYHHDNCYNGLLAHSTKVTRLAQILKFYPTLQKAIDKDTLFIGAAIHDVGKILEYSNGAISQEGRMMSHLTLGIFLVAPYKDRIIELKGAKFYDDLMSIISQHHNEWGERPRTLVAYIIHVLDKLEAQLTAIQELVVSSTSDNISYEELKLSFTKGEDSSEKV